jgi:hypothetical protein
MTRIDRRRLLALTAAAAVAPSVSHARQSGWSSRAQMPWVAQEIYAAVHEGRIWTAGGLVARPGGIHINDRTAIYDPAADRWTEGPRLPQPRHHPMLVSQGGRLWAFGGYDRREGDWTSMQDVWAVDGEQWVQAGRMPQPLAETVGAALGDHIHLVTGRRPGEANAQWRDQKDTSDHLIFAPADGLWDTARPAPMARNSAAGAVMNGHLYVAGGRTVDGGGTGRLDRYDPETDAWDTLAPIPPSPTTGRQVGGGLVLLEVGRRLVAFGGEWFAPGGGGGVFSATWIYDIGRDAWTQGPEMLTPRHGLAGATVDGVAYAIGGGSVVGGGAATGTVEALRLT